jgi:alkylhydroperoxidase family enzyme
MADINIPETACGRLPPPVALTAFVREQLAKTDGFDAANARPLNSFAVLAHSETVFRAMLAVRPILNGATSELTLRDRLLIILRVGCLTNGEYEVHFWRPQAAAMGLSDAQVATLLDPHHSAADDWEGRDRAIVLLAESLSASNTVSDEVFEQVCTQLTPSLLVEAAFRVGYTRMLMGVFNTARVPVDNT